MIDVGDTAPPFTLPGTESDREDPDGEPHQYDLESAIAEGPLVLNFYLFDFHPACTTHVCDLQDLSWFDLEEGVTVYGVSTDRTFSHDAFASEQGLGYPLLSDSDGTVAENYGVLYDEFQGHNRISKRSVFLIDTDGTVQYVWTTEDPTAQPNWNELHDELHALLE